MEEFAFLIHLKDNPAALAILFVLIVYKAIDLLVRFIFSNSKKSELVGKLEKIDAFMEKDAIDRKKRQDEVDGRLDKHYEYIKEAALQSGIAVIWTDKAPLLELFKASLLSIRLGANGNIKEKLLEVIIKNPNGKTLWKSVLSAYKRDHGDMGEHFKETINWIEKRLM